MPSSSSVIRKTSTSSLYQLSLSCEVPPPLSPLIDPGTLYVGEHEVMSVRGKPSSVAPSQSSLRPSPLQPSVVEPVLSEQVHEPPAVQPRVPSLHESVSPPSQLVLYSGSSVPSALPLSQSSLMPPLHRSTVDGELSMHTTLPATLQVVNASRHRSLSPVPSHSTLTAGSWLPSAVVGLQSWSPPPHISSVLP